jgi:hypothetical protein
LDRARAPRGSTLMVLGGTALLAACARYDYDLGSERLPGAGGEGGASGAAGAGAVRERFSPPELVESLSDPDSDDDDPTLTEDLLEIHFSSTRDGGLGESDIWRSVRASAQDAWEPPVLVEELSSPLAETSVALAPDGRTIWVATDREGGAGGFDIWIAEREDRDSPWSTLAQVSSLSTSGDEIVRSATRSFPGVMLAGRPAEETPYDLFRVAGDAASGYEGRIAFPELNTDANEADPFLAASDLTLYFTSDRANADDDLYVAQRLTTDGAFSEVEPLEELNTSEHDSDPWLSADERYIMFASESPDGLLNLYEARR